MSGKFKFCFLKFHGIFFSNIFHPLVESMDMEPADMKGQLYFLLSKYQIPSKYIIPYTVSN